MADDGEQDGEQDGCLEGLRPERQLAGVDGVDCPDGHSTARTGKSEAEKRYNVTKRGVSLVPTAVRATDPERFHQFPLQLMLMRLLHPPTINEVCYTALKRSVITERARCYCLLEKRERFAHS